MPDMRPQGEVRPGNPRGHEGNDISTRGIVGFALGLIGLGVIVHVALGFVMGRFAAQESRVRASVSPLMATPIAFNGPHLQGSPGRDRIEAHQEQLRRLNGYGWVDRKAGIAHIPIDRAIDVLAERGLPEIKGVPDPDEAQKPAAKGTTP